MKRLFSLLLSLLMALSLAACSDSSSVGIIGGADGPTDIIVSDSQSYEGEEYETYEEYESYEEYEDWSEEEAPAEEADSEDYTDTALEEETLPEDGIYTSKEDVAYFIYLYGRLPDNFMTKNEARDLGWEGGSLEPFAPDMCIGGDRFGNREGLLPEAEGRYYTECDIDTLGAQKRGAKRIVFSNDGLIYYTEDHYESFELLYGEE